MDNGTMTSNDLVDIIRVSGSEEIDKAHIKLEKTISNLDRETLEALCVRMTYALEILTGE